MMQGIILSTNEEVGEILTKIDIIESRLVNGSLGRQYYTLTSAQRDIKELKALVISSFNGGGNAA